MIDKIDPEGKIPTMLLVDKINEIIDAINGKEDIPKDAEKWIGKLVWVWDDYRASAQVEELLDIDRDSDMPYIVNVGGVEGGFRYAEPVKSYEIYKGDNNGTEV